MISFPALASEICPDGVYKYDSELKKTVCSAPVEPIEIPEEEIPLDEESCIITLENDTEKWWKH